MTSVDRQDEVIGFLTEYLTANGIAPKRITTHISEVFLAGDRAFKLKRAVRFPFLDFTTLDQRAEACRREVEINRRTAPELYLRVVAVTEGPDGLAFDGGGEVVDWLVEMNRFDERTLFDRLASDPANLPRRLMERMADEIASLHSEARVDPVRGGHRGIRKIAENNVRAFLRLPKGTFQASRVDAVAHETLARIDALADILDRRRADGYVRACHGDLHLKNICLVDGRPTLFDAIEFSDDFSNIDVLYDVAFLLMDLLFRGLDRQASFVMNRYLDIAPKSEGAFRVLPVFMTMRAQIRAHIGAAIAAAQSSEAERDVELTVARRYLDLAERLVQPSSPMIIAVGGLSGSGKSRLARELAPSLDVIAGARVIRTDVIRKRMLGKRPEERLGPGGYTPEVTAETYRAFMQAGSDALADGKPVILDAVFAKPDQRVDAEKMAKNAGVPFLGLWVDAPEAIRMARADARTGNASDADSAIAKAQSSYDLGPLTWTIVDSSGRKEDTLAAALAVCTQRRLLQEN